MDVVIGLMTAGAAILLIVVTNWASTLGARVARILEILEPGGKDKGDKR